MARILSPARGKNVRIIGVHYTLPGSRLPALFWRGADGMIPVGACGRIAADDWGGTIMAKVLIVYHSLSGNTRAAAEAVLEQEFPDHPQGFAHDAPGHARAEIVAVVEAVDGLNHVFLRKAGIFKVRKLVASDIRDGFAGEEAFARALVV